MTGSNTLVKMMKSMAIEALSLVMATWWGTSRNCSRRSTRVTRSVIGLITTRPGPRAPLERPSRNTTTRWYSRTILIAAAAPASRATTTIGDGDDDGDHG